VIIPQKNIGSCFNCTI